MATREREKTAARREKRKAMGPQATLKWLRMAPRKVRLIADLIRGKQIEEALNLLAFADKAAARPVQKLIRSALANADTMGTDIDKLIVKTIHVDEGPTWRRWRPRAMGRATRIRKRTSHVTVVLGEKGKN
jgi:large subunit ribosomal protein L22